MEATPAGGGQAESDLLPTLVFVAGVLLFCCLGLGAQSERTFQSVRERLSADPVLDVSRRIELGDGADVYYEGELRHAAEQLGKALRELGYARSSVLVSRQDGVWVLRVYLSSSACDEPQRRGAFRAVIGVKIAAVAFPDQPVEIRLCGDDNKTRATFAIGRAGRVAISPKETVYYRGAVRNEAEKFARHMQGQLDGQAERAFFLSHDDPFWVVTFSTGPVEKMDLRRLDGLRDLARDFSSNVFGGKPVAIDLLDANYNVGKRIVLETPPGGEPK